MTAALAFVACVEEGPLEAQTLLLCRSIRRLAGRFADAPIHTFQPRVGMAVAPETRAQLADLGVHHHAEPLNLRFPQYAIGNKVFAAARAEEIEDSDFVVFVDSDSVIVSEPRALALRDGIDAAARPVDIHRSEQEPASDDDPHWRTRFRRVSSSGAGDPMDDYWLRMYDLLGITVRPFIETTCSRQRIRAYFNSGLVSVRRAARLFASWRNDLLALIEARHIPHRGTDRDWHYLDQLSLAATLTRVWDRVEVLDGRYNYPLPGQDALAEPYRSMPFDQLVHVHYNSLFDAAIRITGAAETRCN
jgi:hypothetical protein